MKAIRLIACTLTLLSLAACSSRSAPVSAAVGTETSAEESAVLESTAVAEENTKSTSGETLQVDLSPLSKSALGQALSSCIKEVTCVTITDTGSGEVVYESTDEVLSQSIFDAMQIVNEEFDSLDIRPYDFQVDFDTQLGIQKSYGIWVNFIIDNNVIVQSDNGLWDVPITESNWLRARLTGLA